MPALLRRLERRSNWGASQGPEWFEDTTSTRSPWFPDLPILKSSLKDGERPSWSASNTERSDLQSGNAPSGTTTGGFAIEWAEKFTSLPSNLATNFGWLLLGPEIHSNDTAQATFMFEINGSQRRQVRMHDQRRLDCGPIVIGRWYYWRIEMKPYNTGSTSKLRVYRAEEGQNASTLMGEITGGIAKSTGVGYWKNANYRNAGLSGVSAFHQQGFNVFDGLPADRALGSGSGGGTPEPSPEPLPNPDPITIPAPPDAAANRLGVSAGSGLFQPSQANSKRVSIVVPSTRVNVTGIRVLRRGRNTGSGTQAETGVIYKVTDASADANWPLIGVTLPSTVTYNESPRWDLYERTGLPTLTLEAGQAYAFGTISDVNEVTEYGIGQTGLRWALDSYTDGPSDPWRPSGSTGGSDSKSLDGYLVIEAAPAAPTQGELVGFSTSTGTIAMRLTDPNVAIPAEFVRFVEYGPALTFHRVKAQDTRDGRWLTWNGTAWVNDPTFDPGA